MSFPRYAKTLVLALIVSVGLASFGIQATASELTKKVKKTVIVYTSPQEAWDRTETDGGPEGVSAGDIVYFSGQYFPTLAEARSMKGPKKYFLQVMTLPGKFQDAKHPR